MSTPSYGFNRILDDLARRQLKLDFDFAKFATAYEPRRNIGAGAFGIVAEAVILSSSVDEGKHVAIKKIGHASSTPTLARRTLREVRVLRYLQHPNIVKLRDWFRTTGVYGTNVFLVMDLMEGSLHSVIYGNTEPLDYKVIGLLLHQILKGVRYIHKAGIAHRDLKPSNLLVNSDGHLRIADFGMAILARGNSDEADEHSFYMTQHIATLPYRAPELLFVMPEHSTAVDMWAIGCILAEMILRRELFSGRCVGSQIKIVIQNLGTPSKKMISQIQCDRMRQFIQSFGCQTPLCWTQILRCHDRNIHPDAIDMISRLVEMDPNERMDVHGALVHDFVTAYFPVTENERVCPFKVKLDMAAVEDIDHATLLRMIDEDIQSADYEMDLVKKEIYEDEEADSGARSNDSMVSSSRSRSAFDSSASSGSSSADSGIQKESSSQNCYIEA